MQVQVRDVGFGYSPYPHELSRDTSISLQAKGLYAVYGSFVSVTDQTAWPSSQYICKLCGVNEKTFWKYKRELLKAGWISEQQQHRANGQYSSMLITRYYHPSMNPFFSTKSTVLQKTEHRKTEHQKAVVEQEPTGNKNQENTQTKAGCVSSRHELTEKEQSCIEWIVCEAEKRGSLANPAGLRVVLTRAAQKGTLDTKPYEAHMATRTQARVDTNKVLTEVEKWQAEAQREPLTADFFAEQRRKYPALFSEKPAQPAAFG